MRRQRWRWPGGRPPRARKPGASQDSTEITPAAAGSNPGTVDQGVGIPVGVRIASEWSWRFLVIAAASAVLGYLVIQLRLIVVPVLIGLLVTALVIPIVDWLVRLRLPRGAAAGITLVGVLVVIGGLLTLVGQQIASGFSDLATQVTAGIDQIHRWLRVGPLQMSDAQLQSFFQQLRTMLGESSSQLTQGALRFGTTLGHVLAGFFLVLFSTLFMLYQGDKIWAWIVRLFPRAARERTDGAGRRAWLSLTAFVRATVLVAFVDAVGIAVVALVLRVPLAIPIGVLVFLASFIPVVGAVVSGAVAVLVALVAHGPISALIMLAGVLAVQQIESHVLQPFLLGRLVRIHPLAIILAIAAGAYLAGIAGALFAVPVVAVVNAIVSYLASGPHSDVQHTVPASAGTKP